MKKIIFLLLTTTLFSCETPLKDQHVSQQETLPDQQVAFKVLNDYVSNCNSMKSEEAWVENNELLTTDFKEAYKKMMQEAWEDDPELGLGFDPIVNAQDYPEKGFKLASGKSSDSSIVILEGIDMDMTVKVKLKEIKGKWLVDGMGVIRMPEK
jgi:hypothetical protein